MVPEQLRYSPTHEWARVEGEVVVIGLTETGVASVGDVIYAELPTVGEDVLVEVPFGEIEGTKDLKELNSPVDGQVAEANAKLVTTPELLQKDPYGDGWLIKLKPLNPTKLEHLLSPSDYADLTKKKGK